MLAEDLRQLLEHLKIAQTHFVGLSMGGMIGQTLVLKQPDLFDRVVLADTGHTQTPETKKTVGRAHPPSKPRACSLS